MSSTVSTMMVSLFGSRIATYTMKWLLLSCCWLGVAACGGGGGDDSEAPTGPSLFVNAGPDQQVFEQTTVALTGQVQSDSANLTYSWSVTPGLTIEHPDQTVADATFTAPTLTESTAYTFTLRVADNSGNAATDDTVITVLPENSIPVADIQVPVWEGLSSNTYPAGVAITLDGSGSFDPDNSTSTAIVAYEWQQVAGPDVLEGVETNLSQLSISTPSRPNPQTLQFSLTVTDEEQATGEAQVTLNIQSQSQTLPVVNAGVDHAVYSGETIILNGSASTSVPQALPLVSEWQISGVDAVFIDQVAEQETFAIAPLVDSATAVTFELVVTDAFNNVVSDTITVNVERQPLTALNDTGVLLQASTDVIAMTHQAEYPGQDAQRGQDSIANNGFQEKAGRGAAGFDFTRLNQNGDEVDDVNQPWRCIRDNITGYVWEVKTIAAGLQSNENLFSWYQETGNGGFEGDQNGPDTQCTLDDCNTTAYVNAVNAEGLCGFFDWRLPRHDELLSIIHFGVDGAAMVDADYFPFTGGIAQAPLWYWTVQPNADGVQGDDAQNAWAIDFASGVDNFLNKSEAARIRLVRAGRP